MERSKKRKLEQNQKTMPKFGDPNPMHPDKPLQTRRDFLSSGLVGFSAAVMMPSIFDLVLFDKRAYAGECPEGSVGGGMMPFIVFDCAGGASLSGNWLVTDQEGKAGQPLGSYSQLGLGRPGMWVVDNRFGAPMPGPLALNPDLFSSMLVTLTDDAMLPPEVRACLRMGIFCHTSLSDSGMNPLSAVTLVTAAGAQGSRMKNGIGQRNSLSAGNSEAASFDPAFRPLGIQNLDSLSRALTYGPAFRGMPVKMKEALANALVRLSASQGRKLASLTLGDQFTALSQCGFLKNMGLTADTGGIDAREDSDVAPIFNLTAPDANGAGGTAVTDQDAVVATLMKNAIEGNTGPAVITIGGCDYHNGTRATGDGKDVEIATRIAQACRIAYAKGKPLAFQVFTDGGIYSDNGDRVWRGDDNDKSLTVFGIMDPSGPREMVANQIGRYTAGQGADRNHFLGTDPARVAHAVFANYLAANGQLGRYESIAKLNPLPVSKLESLLLFPNKA